MKSVLKILEDKVAKDKSFAMKLSLFLGYKSAQTVLTWIRKKRIPHWQFDNIDKFFKELNQ